MNGCVCSWKVYDKSCEKHVVLGNLLLDPTSASNNKKKPQNKYNITANESVDKNIHFPGHTVNTIRAARRTCDQWKIALLIFTHSLTTSARAARQS